MVPKPFKCLSKQHHDALSWFPVVLRDVRMISGERTTEFIALVLKNGHGVAGCLRLEPKNEISGFITFCVRRVGTPIIPLHKRGGVMINGRIK